MDNDFNIYGDRSYSSLIQSVVESTEKRRDQVTALIEDLRILIKGPGDIPVIVPFIREYLDVGTANDGNLTKLAGILIKLSIASTAVEGDDGYLTEEDRKQLFKEVKFVVEDVQMNNKEEEKQLNNLNSKVKHKLG